MKQYILTMMACFCLPCFYGTEVEWVGSSPEFIDAFGGSFQLAISPSMEYKGVIAIAVKSESLNRVELPIYIPNAMHCRVLRNGSELALRDDAPVPEPQVEKIVFSKQGSQVVLVLRLEKFYDFTLGGKYEIELKYDRRLIGYKGANKFWVPWSKAPMVIGKYAKE